MSIYLLVPHLLPAMCRSRAATSINADWPSGKAPSVYAFVMVLGFSRAMAGTGVAS